MIRKLQLCLMLLIPLMVFSGRFFAKEAFSVSYNKNLRKIKGRVTASDDQLSIPSVSVDFPSGRKYLNHPVG